MKLKNLLIFMFFPIMLFAQERTINIRDLFTKCKEKLNIKNSQLNTEKANLGYRIVASQLFTKNRLFGTYDYTLHLVVSMPNNFNRLKKELLLKKNN